MMKDGDKAIVGRTPYGGVSRKRKSGEVNFGQDNFKTRGHTYNVDSKLKSQDAGEPRRKPSRHALRKRLKESLRLAIEEGKVKASNKAKKNKVVGVGRIGKYRHSDQSNMADDEKISGAGSDRGRRKKKGAKEIPSTSYNQAKMKSRKDPKFKGLPQTNLDRHISTKIAVKEAKSEMDHRDAVERTARRKQATNDDDSGKGVMRQGAEARGLRRSRRNKAASYKKEIRARKKVGGLAWSKRPKSIRRDRETLKIESIVYYNRKIGAVLAETFGLLEKRAIDKGAPEYFEMGSKQEKKYLRPITSSGIKSRPDIIKDISKSRARGVRMRNKDGSMVGPKQKLPESAGQQYSRQTKADREGDMEYGPMANSPKSNKGEGRKATYNDRQRRLENMKKRKRDKSKSKRS